MKEQEIRNREALNEYLELVRQDSETLLRDKSSFVSIACPGCASTSHAFQFEKFGFHYVQCRDCETLFVNPRPPYQELKRIYENSRSTKYWVEEFFLPVAEIRREKIFKPRAEFIGAEFPGLSQGRIGDVGAGFGLFLQELKKIWMGADLVAIEPSADMASICRSKGVSVIERMLEEMDPSPQFDLLTAFELFEHIYAPQEFLKKIFSLLKPGGYFLLTTLNGLGFDIQLLWERSKSVFPPNHLNFFNPRAISGLLERAGFETLNVTTPGELDWDIVEGIYQNEGTDPGRFFKTVSDHGTDQAKRELQTWIKNHRFSSHMRAIARK